MAIRASEFEPCLFFICWTKNKRVDELAASIITITITIMQSITMITMMTNIRMRMPEHMRMKSKPGLPAAKPPTARCYCSA